MRKENIVETRKLTEDEFKIVENMFNRIHALLEAAYEYETKK